MSSGACMGLQEMSLTTYTVIARVIFTEAISNIIIRNPNAPMRSELFLNSVLGEDCFGLESSPNPRNDTFYVIWCLYGFARDVIDNLHRHCEGDLYPVTPSAASVKQSPR